MNLLSVDPSTSTHATAAANSAVVITRAAVPGRIHVLKRLVFSYSAAPTAGKLTVVVGGITICEFDIVAAGPGPIVFETSGSPGLHNNIENQAMVVTLAAAGGSVIGKLSITTI